MVEHEGEEQCNVEEKVTNGEDSKNGSTTDAGSLDYLVDVTVAYPQGEILLYTQFGQLSAMKHFLTCRKASGSSKHCNWLAATLSHPCPLSCFSCQVIFCKQLGKRLDFKYKCYEQY